MLTLLLTAWRRVRAPQPPTIPPGPVQGVYRWRSSCASAVVWRSRCGPVIATDSTTAPAFAWRSFLTRLE